MASVNKVADRIMQSAKVIDETGCWEWLLSKQKNGAIRVGKKRAGRLLDDVQHDRYPKGGA